MYIPGEAPLLDFSSKSSYLLPSEQKELPYKRAMTPIEYNYYHSFLSKDTTAKPVKAAIAVVLHADLKILFKENWKIYQDELVTKWVDVYKTLKGADVTKAQSEIKAFDDSLFSSVPASTFSDLAIKQRLGYVTQLTEQDIKDYENQKMQELLRQEEQTKSKTEEIELKARQALVLESAVKEFMKNNIKQFLSALLVNHPVSLLIDKKISELEYEFRFKVIDSVEIKGASPSEALESYRKALNLLEKNPSKTYFKMVSETFLPIYKHPFNNLRKA